ncbi:Hypothetical predicted protein [Olea europaea subsp. europaea]|uniref:Uncharacterized protein n=1 Tax=Olea europaea subsp. europaea TaxID=158383 RepID=A0A8S0TE23_OLEEU|nr:Hypothetical predicted protein [Olea europaea subsp. europaea]
MGTSEGSVPTGVIPPVVNTTTTNVIPPVVGAPTIAPQLDSSIVGGREQKFAYRDRETHAKKEEEEKRIWAGCESDDLGCWAVGPTSLLLHSFFFTTNLYAYLTI